MKKLLTIASFCLMVLCFGVVLCACSNSGKCNITFSFDTSLASVKVMADGNQVNPNSRGKYAVKDEQNVRVEVYSSVFGVDFSGLELKINGKSRQFFANDEYRPTSEDDSYAGYFLIAKINDDVSVDIDGITMKTAKFNFQCDNVDETQEKLKKISINTNGNEYVGLYDFLTSENPQIERPYDKFFGVESSYRSVNFKFDDPSLFDFSTISFLTISDENNTQFATSSLNTSEFLNISYDNILYADEFDVHLDLSSLDWTQFLIEAPQDNATFQIQLEKDTICYEEEGSFVFVKKNTPAIFEGLRVFLNMTELTDKTDNQDGTITYKIPSKITPRSTGGATTYTIVVDGITYPQGATYSMYVSSIEFFNGGLPILDTSIGVLNEDLSISPFSFGSDGRQIALEGQTVSLRWGYNQVEVDNKTLLRMPYELYDYSLFVNDEKLFNLSQYIPDKEDATFGQDVEQTILNEYHFFAKFDEALQKYVDFEIQCKITQELVFRFDEFVPHKQKVLVGFDFEDKLPAISVEYVVYDFNETPTQWQELVAGELVETEVAFGQFVAFRIKTDINETVETYEVQLSNKIVCHRDPLEVRTVEDEFNFTQFSFEVSEYLWEDLQEDVEFKLVLGDNFAAEE